jgi:DNA-binding XRE family transcriptional regulator
MEIIRRVDNNVEFYTVTATGKSGMSQSGLSILSGVTRQAIIKIEKTLVTEAPSKTLERFVGKDFTLVTENAMIDGKPTGNLNVYASPFCGAVIRHYAYKGNDTAQYSLEQFSDMGIEKWIQEITGWTKPNQPSQASMVGYWAERQRLFIQKTTIPSGWFCVFEELAKLMWQLENLGMLSPTTVQ